MSRIRPVLSRSLAAVSSVALFTALMVGASAASAEVTPAPVEGVAEQNTQAPSGETDAPVAESPIDKAPEEQAPADETLVDPAPVETDPIEVPAEQLEAMAAAAPGSTPVYRFHNPVSGGHVYVSDVNERNHIYLNWGHEWKYEGVRFNVYSSKVPGTTEVYRFYSPRLQSHFYTTDANEKDRVIETQSNIWTYEKIAFYVYPTGANIDGSQLAERFWSDKFLRHFYSADAAEISTVKANWPTIWSPEGARFRVLPGTAEAPLPELPKVQWPIARNVWTWSSSTNGFSSWHPGVDMMSPRNTPMYAIADGTVITSTEGSGSGLGVYIEVEHQVNGQRVVSRYGHMQYGTREVARGTQVKKGQKLGGVGDSGNAYGTHLHFEVVVNGNKVDPMWWLPNNGADK